MIKWFNSPDLREIWMPTLKSLCSVLIKMIIIAVCVTFLLIHFSSRETPMDNALNSWASEIFIDNSKVQSSAYNIRIEFVADMIFYFKKRMNLFAIHFVLYGFIFMLVINLSLSAIDMVTQTVLLKRGIKINELTIPKLARSRNSIIISGAIAISLLIILIYLKVSIAITLWTTFAAFLIFISIIAIKINQGLHEKIGDKIRKYMILEGAKHFLSGIFALWFIIIMFSFFSNFIIENLTSLRFNIQEYAVLKASLNLPEADQQKALNAVYTGLTRLDHNSIQELINKILPPLRFHLIRIILLALYMIYAAPFCALRYRRPHLAFWVGGGLLAICFFIFNLSFEKLLGDYTYHADIKFLLALTGVGLGFYIAYLLDPIFSKLD